MWFASPTFFYLNGNFYLFLSAVEYHKKFVNIYPGIISRVSDFSKYFLSQV